MGDEGDLKKEITRLTHCVDDLRADLEQCRSELHRITISINTTSTAPTTSTQTAIVRINVGGRVFTTRRSTLCSVPGSFLEAMFSGRHREEVDENGMVFIDRDPSHFATILSWLRDPHAPHVLPNDPVFRHEVEYYGLAHQMLRREFLYIVGGERDFEERDLNTVFRFDSVYGEWLPVQSMTIPRSYCTAAVLGTHIYAVGGHSSGVFQRTVERYDPETNAWAQVAKMTRARSACACAVLDNKLYAIGGFDGDERLDSTEVYDPAKNTWEVRASLAAPRAGAACAVLDGCIYIVGGHNGPTTFDTVEKYDPSKNEWTAFGTMTKPRNSCCCAVLNGKLYVVAGEDENDTVLASVECYDVAQNTWCEVAPLSSPRAGAMCGVLNGKLYVIAGVGTEQVSSECYDPDQDTWSVVPPLPMPRSYGAAAVLFAT